ncbi:MAG: penicillin-binding protein [Luteibaculaceae bacterium]
MYFLYFIALAMGMAVSFKIFMINVVEGDVWRSKSKDLTLDMRKVEATRGNIYADNGALLATSVPVYEVRMDFKADGLTDELFYNSVDSLSRALSNLFGDQSAMAWKQKLIAEKNKGNRYALIKHNVNYREWQKLKTFPIFRLGRYKGGVIYVKHNKRQMPFRGLAGRTIGYDRDGVGSVGLEAAYKQYLAGVDGKILSKRISGGVWMPLDDTNKIDPEDGADIYTTLDLNIQDVASSALLEQLKKHRADHGTVILMEVETGFIKSISNLSLGANGRYYENYNYAIGEATEPGSVYKLASFMAAIEDGFVKITDSVATGNGTITYYDRVMSDSKKGGYGTITIKDAFKYSSNVGVSKVIWDNYKNNPQKFVDRLRQFGLDRKLGVTIPGEGKPILYDPSDKNWSGTTLTSMSIGYAVTQTPLQTLAFYNAVANNGKMVKPQFVKEIKKGNKTIKSFKPEVIIPSIASEKTIKQAREMLEAVVESGTATNLQTDYLKIAGKTGTARISNGKYGYNYQSNFSYQASFVGYFPAEKPKYSCIVVINAPSSAVYYGNLVAGPIFREIADKIYSTRLDFHEPINRTIQLAEMPPISKNGNSSDLALLYNHFNIKVNHQADDADWVKTYTGDKDVTFKSITVSESQVPDVLGMGLQDALFLLENRGLKVRFSGKGFIRHQSIPPGTRAKDYKEIYLELAT